MLFVEITSAVALGLLCLLASRHFDRAVVLVAALLPAYLIRLRISGIPTTFLELSILLVALGGILDPTTRRQWSQRWLILPKKYAVATVLFAIAAIISTVISPHLFTSLGVLKGWILVPILYGWLVWVVSARAGVRRHLIFALLISGIAMAAVALLLQAGDDGRLKGIYDVPNSLALYLVPLCTIAIWQVYHGPHRLFSGLAALIMVPALLGTQSVAGIAVLILALASGVFLQTNLHRRRRLIMCILGITLGATVWLIASGRVHYFLRSEAPTSLDVRGQLWSVSADLIKQSPLLGIGLGTFEPAYQQALHERFIDFETRKQDPVRQNGGHEPAKPLHEFVFRDPHNWILSFWLNLGLLGLGSFVYLNFSALHSSQKSLQLALVSLLIFGLVDTIYWKNDLASLHWLVVTVILSGMRPIKGLSRERRQAQA